MISKIRFTSKFYYKSILIQSFEKSDYLTYIFSITIPEFGVINSKLTCVNSFIVFWIKAEFVMTFEQNN